MTNKLERKTGNNPKVRLHQAIIYTLHSIVCFITIAWFMYLALWIAIIPGSENNEGKFIAATTLVVISYFVLWYVKKPILIVAITVAFTALLLSLTVDTDYTIYAPVITSFLCFSAVRVLEKVK